MKCVALGCIKFLNTKNCCSLIWSLRAGSKGSKEKSVENTCSNREANCCSSSPRRQMADGRMLPPLHQWHRPQKDPGAFIRILPTEYIHLCASPPHKPGLMLLFTVFKEFPVPQFWEVLWNLRLKKKKRKRNFFCLQHLGYKLKFSQWKSKQSMDICTDFMFYSEAWGFTHYVFMSWGWNDMLNKIQ